MLAPFFATVIFYFLSHDTLICKVTVALDESLKFQYRNKEAHKYLQPLLMPHSFLVDLLAIAGWAVGTYKSATI